MALNDVKWKPAFGFEGFYEVSNDGQIKSIQRLSINPNRRNRVLKEKILKGCKDKDGYIVVSLSNGNKKEVHKVHRIVAKSFIENAHNKKTVNHINGIKSDNRVENLEWNTHRENSLHRSLSKDKTSKYSNIHFCKTTNKWIAQIQSRYFKKMIGAFVSEEIAYEKLIEYKKSNGIN